MIDRKAYRGGRPGLHERAHSSCKHLLARHISDFPQNEFKKE